MLWELVRIGAWKTNPAGKTLIRAATDACQAAFNKACMRVLIERLVHSNRRLADAVQA